MDQYIQQALTVIANLSSQYGPSVVEASLSIARIDALQSLLMNVFWAIVLVAWVFNKTTILTFLPGPDKYDSDHKKWLLEVEARTALVAAWESKGVRGYDIPTILKGSFDKPEQGNYVPRILQYFFFYIPAFVLLVLTLWTLNIYAWVGIFEPKLWLGYKALVAAKLL